MGANKNSIKIIGDHTEKYVQAYFYYDSKKSGGVTVSQLRFGDKPIKSTYFVSKADFVACHNTSYIGKYDMVQDLKPGGTFLLNCAWSAQELDKHLPARDKKYIAENNIQLCTCDGIGLAREIGLGGRINMILQAAFFKLTGIIAIDDAVKYMKDAVVATYGRKGEKVVAMNHAAIDAGINAVNKITIPDSWKTASGDKAPAVNQHRPEMVSYVENILNPVNAQRGDSLPVSTFVGAEDGTFPQGAAAYEKRGIAVDVPEWIPENCIQCNQCAYVCPHAVIRPFVFDEKEAAAAPAGTKLTKMTGKGLEGYQFSITPSVLDCTGCGSCANVCPAKTKALVMKPLESQTQVQAQYDYAFEKLTDKDDVLTVFKPDSVKGSQFKQPLMEFSGACAGCGETPYARLITQLFGDRMYLANATGCSSIWGGSAPSTPYTVNKKGKGPAWANSLFEDNAEYGYGMYLGMMQLREKLAQTVDKLIAIDYATKELKDAGKAWLDSINNGEASKQTAPALVEALKGAIEKDCDCEACALASQALESADLLVKKSMWIFGGDGWAYDIGFGGLDHVIASGKNVNIFVFDTEVYSNTGGQASKASQIGQVAQFAASGKTTAKKDLAQIAMSYGYVYVAQIAMGASYQQTIKAITEAESYDGPSLVIAYAPCINHGIRAGMGTSMAETKAAVDAGYWHMFRFDPRLKEQGKNPFQLDSKAPTTSYADFIKNEVRYSSLNLSFPERAKVLFENAEKVAGEKYEKLQKLTKFYE